VQFDRPSHPEESAGWHVPGPLRALAARALGVTTLERLYRAMPSNGQPFWARALDALDARYEVADEDLDRVPATGPLLVVANHPFGGLDGLILLSVLHRVRPDVKVLATSLLRAIPDLRDHCLYVDTLAGRSAAAANAGGVRAAIQWARRGGAIGLFPAGEVAHARTPEGTVVDSAWPDSLARLVRHTGATVLPIFFEGANSRLFTAAGRVHPLLRTALLPRELLRKRHSNVQIRIGAAVPARRLVSMACDSERVSYLRLRTDALRDAGRESAGAHAGTSTRQSDIAPATPARRVAAEIAALPGESCLGRSGSLAVYFARAADVPATLLEIGRLREITFRAAGEGSGHDRDLDVFDERYDHLVAWNHDRAEVVGAYRIGRTDALLPRYGTSGLYTSTLFQYDRRLLDQLDPALELGRAFVRPEYQKDYSPLLLLWKGIGTFVSRNPRYRMLFGPVSISNDYRSISREILLRFLYATSLKPDFARFVTPRNPPACLDGRGAASLPGAIVKSIAEVGALLAEIESDQKGVPVLLRQYLKLNAKLLGFNVDPAFGNALDGLMLVDLLDVDRTLLARYLGTEGSRRFLAHHQPAPARLVS
jgi:putative hemolysin